MKAHLLFEQSGTFKKEFLKIGWEAYDYDILNDFNETDYVIDLFNEIEKAYDGKESLFDTFAAEDYIFAFFPCVRFENQIIMYFQGNNHAQRNWSNEKKLEYDLKLHKELSHMYDLITKLTIVCIRHNFKLIIENPFWHDHYLTRYWCIKPKIIDIDRSLKGDYYKKPTQYWFINCEPKNNFYLEHIENKDVKIVKNVHNKVERSMISPIYANRFIREYILDEIIEGE